MGVGQEAGEEMQAGCGEAFARVAGKGVAAAFALDQRLMQVPAAMKKDSAAPAGT